MPWRFRTHRFTSGLFVVLLAYLAMIVVIDELTSRYMRLDVYAAIAPVVAAALCTYRQTIVIGALDFIAMTAIYGVLPADVPAITRAGAILSNALMVGASIAVARLLRDREALLERERATGEAAQRALLRQLPLRTREVVVDGFYVSSQRDALVGGDLYEAVQTPYGTRVLIGDVQGKGLSTLGAGAAVLTAFREAAYHRRSLTSGVVAMEQGLGRYNASTQEQSSPDAPERFVTALVLGTDDTARERADGEPPRQDEAIPLLIVNCGHCAPYLIGPDGSVREVELEEPGLPLGLGELADHVRQTQRVVLPPGCRLLACTDGVTEARAADGSFYPLADRLDRWAALSTPALLGRLRTDLAAHTGGHLQDDAAALIMERLPVADQRPREAPVADRL
ncbi:PP2C family protein-serine/threonine phosphatase [Streptomyces zagrosensis]|uniref:Serine phosphatase RsbU (Regulator of sigma subunit) n=1 Tax=Streptomyces zagrosensis TaxID=1042984 RepID=A0A7W9QDN1_9ACTN|nr:PP2C family protein-serine/threonine phosphatase [Streptomyces zagrosensis]MBB5938366.1 serine phosphatase RsbU (regulator of sigma subunit) [Streptomyces zagrosensis]